MEAMSGAAVGGRQVQRSAAHQRQYSSDYFAPESAAPIPAFAAGVSGRWLQHTGLSPSSLPVEYSKTLRGSTKAIGGEVLLSVEPATTPFSGYKRNGEDTPPGDLSPGLLDLHSFDTELLPEGLYDSASGLKHARDQDFDDFDLNFYSSKLTGRIDNNPSKSFSADKEKCSSVAKIKVVVRKRPLNKKEVSKQEEDIITIDPRSNSLTVHETKLKVDLTEYVEKHEFMFDAVLPENVSNDEVYRETVEPIVPAIFKRAKATCFAYGQTGSGKTYTMQPLPFKASQDILKLIHYTYRNQGFQLFVSFFEIYGGKLFDLLNDKRKLCMREDGKQQVCIVGLQEYKVSDVDTIRELIEKGNASRSTGITGANEESSRSHAILQLVVKKSADGNESKPAKIVGKLSFIDLAGSERGADTTDNDKQTRIEGAEINKSLLALKECIRALDNDQVHIPFRGSKLTEVLRDSFIGDSRTVMISCISPNSSSCEHSLNTLRYADRVKSLSKGNSKKDPSSTSLNPRESTCVPLLSALPVDTGPQNFDLSKQIDKEAFVPSKVDRIPNGGDSLPIPSLYPNYNREHISGAARAEYDICEEAFERNKPSWTNQTANSLSAPHTDEVRRVGYQTQLKDMPGVHVNGLESDDDFNTLLMEEEHLVMAHREQVEETISILREEMKLLEEADQPGNQLDEYLSRLNVILTKKAAGLVNLQARLARFQQLLSQHNVLASPHGL